MKRLFTNLTIGTAESRRRFIAGAALAATLAGGTAVMATVADDVSLPGPISENMGSGELARLVPTPAR